MTGMLEAIREEEKKYCKNLNDVTLANKNLAITETVWLKKELQQSYFSEQIKNCQHDSKKLWRVIKQFWPTKSKSNNITKNEYNFIDIEKANLLNTHFATVGEKLASDIPPEDTIDVPNVMYVPYPNIYLKLQKSQFHNYQRQWQFLSLRRTYS